MLNINITSAPHVNISAYAKRLISIYPSKYDEFDTFCRDFHMISKILANIHSPVNYYNTAQFTSDYPGAESHSIRNVVIDILDRVSKFYPESIIPHDFFEREKLVFTVCNVAEFADINKLYTDLIVGINKDRDSVRNYPDYHRYKYCIHKNIADRMPQIDYDDEFMSSTTISQYFHSVADLINDIDVDITDEYILNAYRTLPANSHKFNQNVKLDKMIGLNESKDDDIDDYTR